MSEMNFETLNFTMNGSIAEIQLNRPKALNAINATMKQELKVCFDHLDAHLQKKERLDGVIIYGGGEKAFAAGADIKEFTDLSPADAYVFAQEGQALFNRIEYFPRPTVAAIHGYALGGGSELALACQMRIAGPKAVLGQPEVNLGIMCGFGGTQRLARMLGKPKALEIVLTGDNIKAEEAYRIGLVNQLVEVGKELETARHLITKIGSKAPLAIEYTLQAINQGVEGSFNAGLELEASLFGNSFATQDKNEGVQAFIEKRKAEFKGE